MTGSSRAASRPRIGWRSRASLASIATNNVMNPFTPFGDASLIRMANLYANVAQVGTPTGLARVFDMIAGDAARLLGLKDYGVVPGAPGRPRDPRRRLARRSRRHDRPAACRLEAGATELRATGGDACPLLPLAGEGSGVRVTPPRSCPILPPPRLRRRPDPPRSPPAGPRRSLESRAAGRRGSSGRCAAPAG